MAEPRSRESGASLSWRDIPLMETDCKGKNEAVPGHKLTLANTRKWRSVKSFE